MKIINEGAFVSALDILMKEIKEHRTEESIASVLNLTQMIANSDDLIEMKDFGDEVLNILKQYRARLVVERATGEIADESIKKINSIMDKIRG